MQWLLFVPRFCRSKGPFLRGSNPMSVDVIDERKAFLPPYGDVYLIRIRPKGTKRQSQWQKARHK